MWTLTSNGPAVSTPSTIRPGADGAAVARVAVGAQRAERQDAAVGADRRRVRAGEDLHPHVVVVLQIVDAAHLQQDGHRAVAHRLRDDGVGDLAGLKSAHAAHRAPVLEVDARLAVRADEVVVRDIRRSAGAARLETTAVEVDAVDAFRARRRS